jgi:predicted amidohydrolase
MSPWIGPGRTIATSTHFSYATARRMIAAGVLPHIVSSDVHGLFPVMHDDNGSRADLTVLEERVEDWPMRDGQGEILVAERRWIPRLVLRAGQPVIPNLRLVRDVTSPAAAA